MRPFIPSIVVGRGGMSKAEASLAMQRARGDRPDARQWNVANVPRLYDLVEVGNPKATHPGQPEKVWVRKRTAFRNVIDENGRHV